MHRLASRRILVNSGVTSGSNGTAVHEGGLELLEGFAAFNDGNNARAVQHLLDVRPNAHVVGGSHAQRDVIELTLIAAAARTGNLSLADTLLGERVMRKPSAKSAALELMRANSER